MRWDRRCDLAAARDVESFEHLLGLRFVDREQRHDRLDELSARASSDQTREIKRPSTTGRVGGERASSTARV
jgi:hypothetical protein